MDNLLKHLPDAWFDIFARFIPGIVFLIAIDALLMQKDELLLWENIFIYLILSYIIGHIIQPLTSVVARTLEYNAFKKGKYIKKCHDVYPADSRESLLLSKQHAECASFSALSILSLLLLAIIYIVNDLSLTDFETTPLFWIIYFIVVSYFITFTFIRAHAVGDRAHRYFKRYEKEQKKQGSNTVTTE